MTSLEMAFISTLLLILSIWSGQSTSNLNLKSNLLCQKNLLYIRESWSLTKYKKRQLETTPFYRKITLTRYFYFFYYYYPILKHFFSIAAGNIDLSLRCFWE